MPAKNSKPGSFKLPKTKRLSSTTEPVELVIIMDRSGSMLSLHKSVVENVNKFVREQRELPGTANVTLVVFNNTPTIVWDRLPLVETPKLLLTDFTPSGMTALNDAIVRTMNSLHEINPAKAMVAIFTDGEENASSHTKHEASQLIEQATSKGWQLQYLGANQDAWQVAQQYNIPRQYTSNWYSDPAGLAASMKLMASNTTSYRADISPQIIPQPKDKDGTLVGTTAQDFIAGGAFGSTSKG